MKNKYLIAVVTGFFWIVGLNYCFIQITDFIVANTTYNLWVRIPIFLVLTCVMMFAFFNLLITFVCIEEYHNKNKQDELKNN